MMTEQEKQSNNDISSQPQGKKAKKPRQPWSKQKKIKFGGTLAVILVIVGIAGVAFWNWHNTPQFCSAFCHNMDQYVDGYYQRKDAEGIDKYGNEVSNTSAMMAVYHRENNTTAKPEINCLDCHHAVITEQIAEGVNFVVGNYYDPLTERVGDDLTKWRNEDEDRFCANENCHVYLMGQDGTVNRDALEKTTQNLEFNPHSQHHNIDLSCTECHKGHRASVLVCTSCHEHEDEAVPNGWLSGAESQVLMNLTFLNE